MFFFVQTIYYYREDEGKKQALFLGMFLIFVRFKRIKYVGMVTAWEKLLKTRCKI